MSPSNYFIMENDLLADEQMGVAQVKDLIAKLSFKLCFLYYNTVGGTKTPAPVHYAHKLSSFVKNNSNKHSQMQPHQRLQEIQSLYFI